MNDINESHLNPNKLTSRTGTARAHIHFLCVLVAIFITAKQWAVVHSFSGTVFGPFLIAACAGTAFLICSFLACFSRSGFLILASLVDLVSSALLYVDLLYYRQFRELPTISSLSLIDELLDVRTSVTILLRPLDLFYFLSCLIPLVFLAFIRFTPNSWTASRPRAALNQMIAGAMLIAVAVIGSWTSVTSRDYLGGTWLARHLGTPIFHTIDIYKIAVRSLRLKVDRESVRLESQAWFRTYKEAPAATVAGSLRPKRNLMVLQVESLQTFVVGFSIEGQEITPALNKIAKNSLYFPNSFAQISRGGTADANFLANCSLLPTDPEIVYIDYAGNDYSCLPEILRSHNFDTSTSQPVPPDCYNFSNAFRQIGFSRFYDKWDFRRDLEIGHRLSDGSLFRQTLERIAAGPRPFFSYITTTTSHTPFVGKNLPHTLRLGPLEGSVVGNYLHAIHYTDAQIGKLFDELDKQDLLDATTIVIFGDHAGVHRENSNISQVLSIPPDDEIGWQLAERMIPIIIKTSNVSVPRTFQKVAGQWDIPPTVLQLLGIPSLNSPFMGSDLLESASGFVPLANGSAVSDELFFLSEAAQQLPQCYERESRKPVELSRCERLRTDAAEATRISRLMIEANLTSGVDHLP